MKDFTYSVAIRTLGTAGEKYEKLMDSIKNQTIKPEKVVVVLPHGYNPPEYRIGMEEFVFCPKGMVIQRLFAMNYIHSDFILFCDDDIEFDENFVEKLSNPLLDNNFDCSSGPLLELLPPKSFKYTIASVLGGACVMIHGKENNFIRILKTGGWSYNRDIDTNANKIYNTESLPWGCFFIKRTAMDKIAFEEEMWVERSGYSSFEDRVFFYKLLVKGGKSCIVSDAQYIHNDAKASSRNLKTEPVYAGCFNHYVFWHRYIYSLSENIFSKLWAKICIEYYIFMSGVYNLGLNLLGQCSKEAKNAKKQGFKDAKKFVKTDEYKNLPAVIKKEK